MKLYILKEVLYDYTDGMCIIAAESMPQCEQIFMEEFYAVSVKMLKTLLKTENLKLS